MGAFISEVDLDPFVTIEPAKAAAMIEDAEAKALAAAPCLGAPETTLTPAQAALVKAVLRQAIIRWVESGGGSFTQQTAGPYSVSVDTRQSRSGIFWPSEIDQLQAVCGSSGGGKAFSVDMSPVGSAHLPWCSSMFGALYCSCGADIAGQPIYELDGYE